MAYRRYILVYSHLRTVIGYVYAYTEGTNWRTSFLVSVTCMAAWVITHQLTESKLRYGDISPSTAGRQEQRCTCSNEPVFAWVTHTNKLQHVRIVRTYVRTYQVSTESGWLLRSDPIRYLPLPVVVDLSSAPRQSTGMGFVTAIHPIDLSVMKGRYI